MKQEYKRLMQIKMTLNNLESQITYGLRESYGISQALSNVEELIISYKKREKEKNETEETS
jgi:hypothetical protein|tara:strand:- start:344 stop:526 length:183 start_codon:yes stop_codon:yes gene_type:complete